MWFWHYRHFNFCHWFVTFEPSHYYSSIRYALHVRYPLEWLRYIQRVTLHFGMVRARINLKNKQTCSFCFSIGVLLVELFSFFHLGI